MEKREQQEKYHEDIRNMISEIKKEYSKKQIRKRIKRYDSLQRMIGLCGHCSDGRGDWDDLFYHAGRIVLFQHHVFSWKYFDEEIFELMREMNIPLDRKMKRHYHKVHRRNQKSDPWKPGKMTKREWHEIDWRGKRAERRWLNRELRGDDQSTGARERKKT